MSRKLLIDKYVAAAPPNIDESYWTVADFRWALERFTSEKWTVTDVEFEDNPHEPIKCVVLQARLEHVGGGLLRCLRFDPYEHQDRRTHYRSHRVIYSPADGTARVPTFDDGEAPAENAVPFDELAGEGSNPYADTWERLSMADLQWVRTNDKIVVEDMPAKGRGYSIESIHGAVTAVIGCAARETRETEAQAELAAFA